MTVAVPLQIEILENRGLMCSNFMNVTYLLRYLLHSLNGLLECVNGLLLFNSELLENKQEWNNDQSKILLEKIIPRSLSDQ